MPTDLKKAKIFFLDDEKKAVNQFMTHLENEGFTNLIHKKDISALNEVIDIQADLIFLDITGVGASLDSNEEGLSVLSYVKKHSPWTAVIVLSGSVFPATKANALSQADQCVTKASLSHAQLLNLTEMHLTRTLSPEYRNVKICNIIEQRIEELSLSSFAKWRLRQMIKKTKKHEGDAGYNWSKHIKKIQSMLSTASNLSTIISLFVA